MPELWPAPFHPDPISAKVLIPGSKSLTNRYLVLAALGDHPVQILNPLLARDTNLMLEGLRTLGARVSLGSGAVTIVPGPFRSGTIDCGLAGTVMRFLPALAMLAPGPVYFDGDASARVRPMDPLVQAIKDLGVGVDHAVNGRNQAVLPLTVHGTGLGVGDGTPITIDAAASSQFISALLLVAPRLARGLDLRISGAAPSMPHVDMTVDVLRESGISVCTFAANGEEAQPDEPAIRWLVSPGIPNLETVAIEPDLSNAGAFLAAAMVTNGSLTISGWPSRTCQPGAAFADIFTVMGARVTRGGDELTLHGPTSIQPLDADLHDLGELVPTIAATAACATGPSHLRNIGHLRGHETDRLAALTTQLKKIGCGAGVVGDDLVITPGPLHKADLETYNDHRMATFAAIIGLHVQGIRIENIATTAKTFPEFPLLWQQMVGQQ